MELEDYRNSADEDELVDSEDEVINFSGDDMAGVPGSTNRDFSIAKCQTLTPDMISKKMFEIIKEVNEVFQVPNELLMVLKHGSSMSLAYGISYILNTNEKGGEGFCIDH